MKRYILGAVIVVIAAMIVFHPADQAPSATVASVSTLDPRYQLAFSRSDQNPIHTPPGGNLASHNIISDPSVLFEKGKYKMWFTSVVNAYSDGQQMGTAYAESADGIVWQPIMGADEGVPKLLVLPTPGGWDGGGVETPSVLKGPDNVYRMYYTGDALPEGSNNWAIGLATSPDGITWTKYGNGPVFAGAGGWEGPFSENGQTIGGVSEPSVIYDAGQKIYKMWYSALGLKDGVPAFRMGYATSPDGIVWKRAGNPVFEPDVSGTWDDAVISHVNVVKRPDNGGYDLLYFGTSAQKYEYSESKGATLIQGALGHAYSTDGITWVRDANPVLAVRPDSWEAWTIGGPAAIIQGGIMKAWYFGSKSYNTYDFHIGLMSAPLGQE